MRRFIVWISLPIFLLLAVGVSAQVVINEIYYDDPGGDNENYIELKNNGSPQPLEGWTVKTLNQDGDVTKTVVFPLMTLGAGAYLVIGEPGFPYVNIEAPGISSSLQAGPCDAVQLFDPVSQIIDAVQYEPAECEYQLGEGEPAGGSSTTAHSIGRFPDGMDTDDNSADFCETCISPGGGNDCCEGVPTSTPTPIAPTPTPPPLPDLVINEIYYDDPFKAAKEGRDSLSYVEIYGSAGHPLIGVNVEFWNQTCTMVDRYNMSEYDIPEDGWFVFGMTGVDNVDYPNDAMGSDFQNGPCDTVRLTFEIGPGVYSTIDTVTYGADCGGPDHFPDSCTDELPSVPEPGTIDYSLSRIVDGLDTHNNLADFCESFLTPGEANECEGPTPTPAATDTPMPTPTPEDCINSGDVNQDGSVTAGDAQLAFLITLGAHTPSEAEFCAADCDANEEVTAGDAQAIFATALGTGTCIDPVAG
ncbi:lamin tail domain-containing protein [Patescibacteria group bacterium]